MSFPPCDDPIRQLNLIALFVFTQTSNDVTDRLTQTEERPLGICKSIVDLKA